MPRKRETIEPNRGDKRYVRRDAQGHFTGEQVDAGRPLARDRKQAARKTVPAGQGERATRSAASLTPTCPR